MSHGDPALGPDFFPDAEPTAPPPPDPAVQRRRRRRRTVVLVVGIGVLIALITLLIVRGIGAGGAPGVQAKPATAAVQFLSAVADADAEKALSFQHRATHDRLLLTDTVLDRSRQLAPISEIDVVLDTPERVELRYLLGDQEVHAQFTPVPRPDGSYRIDRGTATVQVARPDQLPVLMNGVPLTSDEVEAFPGTYELTTGLANIEYSEPRLTISGPESSPQLTPSPRLSPRGTAAFVAATRDQLAACLRSNEVNPPGCPQSLNVAEGTVVDPASVRWTLESDPLVAATPRLSLTNETVAEVHLSVHARLQALVQTPTGPGIVDQSATFNTMATGQVTTDPITVRFTAN